jgi:hypothetical protein
MTTVFERVKNALNNLSPAVPFGQDVYLMADGNPPDTFLVYKLVSGGPAQHADGTETERVYRVQISIYSRNDLAAMPNVDGAMVAAGFSRGPERQLPFTDDTRHFGLAKDFFIKE